MDSSPSLDQRVASNWCKLGDAESARLLSGHYCLVSILEHCREAQEDVHRRIDV